MSVKPNPLSDKSHVFALKVVKAHKTRISAKKEYVLSKQLLCAETSIGANIAEANWAISSADFSANISIGYKESSETKYCLNFLKVSEYLDKRKTNILIEDADELSLIMLSILKSTRIRMG